MKLVDIFRDMVNLVIKSRRVADVIEQLEGKPDRILARNLRERDAKRLVELLRMSPCITPSLLRWVAEDDVQISQVNGGSHALRNPITLLG